MWPFGPPREAPKKWLERLSDVEDELERLNRRFTKIQGEFGAQMREQVRLQRENDELNEELESLDGGGE